MSLVNIRSLANPDTRFGSLLGEVAGYTLYMHTTEQPGSILVTFVKDGNPRTSLYHRKAYTYVDYSDWCHYSELLQASCFAHLALFGEYPRGIPPL